MSSNITAVFYPFLDAFSHLYKGISPLVRPSVHPTNTTISASENASYAVYRPCFSANMFFVCFFLSFFFLLPLFFISPLYISIFYYFFYFPSLSSSLINPFPIFFSFFVHFSFFSPLTFSYSFFSIFFSFPCFFFLFSHF